jgi:AmmeMemoRadiSam system protein A
MARSSCIELTAGERRQLLAIARQSIACGLQGGAALKPVVAQLPPALSTIAAVFVTLNRNHQLRGCIGSLQASEALACAVADAAFSAAFRDPRFVPLQSDELASTLIEISVLSPLQPLAVASRDELLAKLRPGVDGLLLEQGAHRSTFLPLVWQQLATPGLFLEQLLVKAGLPADYWSAGLRFERYQALCFSEPEGTVVNN